MGSQSHFEHCELGQVFERPDNQGVRDGHMEGGSMSGTVSAKSLIGEPKKMRAISPLAGKLAPKVMLVDVVRLEREYFERWPDAGDPNQLVNFGPSGHRGSSLDGTFKEAHM